MSILKLTSIEKTTVSVIILIGLTKFAGLIRDILIANYFGINQIVDLYFFSLIIPFFLSNIISGSFNLYLIPNYIRIKTSHGSQSARQYISRLFILTIAILVAITYILGWIIPEHFIQLRPQIFPQEHLVIIFTSYMKWAAIFFLFMTSATLFSSLLQAEHSYRASLLPLFAIPFFGIIAILSLHKTFHVGSVLYGSGWGALICFVLLWVYALQQKLFTFSLQQPKNQSIDSRTHELFILMVSLILPNIINLIDRSIAMGLGNGKISILTYGQSIPDGFLEIIAFGLSISFFSHFSQWFADQKKIDISRAIQKILLYIVYFITPLCVFLIFFSTPILSLLLERGAFHNFDTKNVAPILSAYSFILIFATIYIIGMRLVSAIGKNITLLILTTILFISKMFLNFIFIKYFHLLGIPLATIGMYIIGTIIIYFYLGTHGIYCFTADVITQSKKGLVLMIFILILLWITALASQNLPIFLRIVIGGGVLSGYYLLILTNKNKLLSVS